MTRSWCTSSRGDPPCKRTPSPFQRSRLPAIPEDVITLSDLECRSLSPTRMERAPRAIANITSYSIGKLMTTHTSPPGRHGNEIKPDVMAQADVANGESSDAPPNGKTPPRHLTGKRQAQQNADNDPPA